MCGLFGVARPTKTTCPLMAERFGLLGQLAQSRGLHAAGWATLAATGRLAQPGPTAISRRQARAGRWTVRKQPGPFDLLWAKRSWIDQRRLDAAVVILGHTRAASQGRVDRLANCSPMVAGRVVGTHNGDVDTDGLLDRTDGAVGETDTELLLTALDLKGADGIAAWGVLAAAPGRAAMVWADWTDPQTIHLARAAYSPLYLAGGSDGSLWWASNPAWLDEIGVGDPMMVPEGTIIEARVGADEVHVQESGEFEPVARPRDILAERFVYAGFSLRDRLADRAQLTHQTMAAAGGW